MAKRPPSCLDSGQFCTLTFALQAALLRVNSPEGAEVSQCCGDKASGTDFAPYALFCPLASNTEHT